MAPEEKEKGDREHELELDEREGEYEAAECGPRVLKQGEAGAEEKQHEDRELAHDQGEACGDEGEKEQEWQGRPARSESVKMRPHDPRCQQEQREVEDEE